MSTQVQDRVFDMVRDGIERHGRSPTLGQISRRFGFSKPRAHTVVRRLVEQGRLAGEKGGTHLLRIPGRVDLRKVGTDALVNELRRRTANDWRRSDVALCGECGLRPDHPTASTCIRTECPLGHHRRRSAAGAAADQAALQ